MKSGPLLNEHLSQLLLCVEIIFVVCKSGSNGNIAGKVDDREFNKYVMVPLIGNFRLIARPLPSFPPRRYYACKSNRCAPPHCPLACAASVLRLRRSTTFEEKASAHAPHASAPTRRGRKPGRLQSSIEVVTATGGYMVVALERQLLGGLFCKHV